MLNSKAAQFICISCLVLGCSRSAAPPTDTSAPVPANPPRVAVEQINAQQAFHILQTELKKHRVANLDCLTFVIEAESNSDGNRDWEYSAREIHNEKCGGDPETSPVRARYQVDAAGKVLEYDVVNGEFHPI